MFKIDFIRLFQPSGAVIKSNEEIIQTEFPLPCGSCITRPFCSQRGGYNLKCYM